jgi:hypothetical protein
VISAVVVAFLVALVAGEATDGSRWVGIRLARWAARRIYHGNASRATARAEEWEALALSLPTSLSAMCFGLGLASAGVACVVMRSVVALWRTSAGLRSTGAERERRDRLADRQRAACLDLLSAVSQLRLRAATASRMPAREIDPYLADIRVLTAGVELAAANVVMLAPSTQVAADRLTEASERLAHAMAAEREVGWRRLLSRPQFGKLDESAQAFLRAAVALLAEAIL